MGHNMGDDVDNKNWACWQEAIHVCPSGWHLPTNVE
jgi:uncharacterized protein (TIGR02145 family)